MNRENPTEDYLCFVYPINSWFCHFDDDIYVNVQNLLALLKKYKHKENVYLGHYSRKWKRLPVSKIPCVADLCGSRREMLW